MEKANRYQPRKFTPGEYDQLVGNKIPDLVKKDGFTPVTHRANDAEYMISLRNMLTAESEQLFSGNNVTTVIEKIARIRILLTAVEEFAGIDRVGQVESIRDIIESREGTFSRRIMLEKVEE